MRILLTGVTGRQSKESRISKQKIYDTKLIRKVLIDLGHEVTWHQTSIMEKWDLYDLAIVALGPVASFNSGNLVNAMWVIDKLPTILHFEDWKITGLLKSYQGCVDNPEKSLLKEIKGGTFYNDAKKYKQFLPQLVSNFEKVLNLDKSNIRCITPGFKWGDKGIIKMHLKTDNVIPFDLTPLVITGDYFDEVNVLWDEGEMKERKYFLASLADHSSWFKKMNFSWPIVTTNKGKEFKTEVEVYREGKKYWGILAPEYDHSGSGWFRIRFVYSALGDSCMICSDKDAEQLGEPFYFNRDQFEHAFDWELEKIAAEQKAIIKSYMTTYDELKETFTEILKLK